MNQQSIICPECGTQIELTEAFTNQVQEKLRKEFNQKYLDEKSKLEIRLKKQVEEELGLEVKDLRKQLEEKSEKLKQAQEQELELRRRQRELEEREQAAKLELERKLDAERKNMLAEITKQYDEKQRLKDAEKDKQIADMLRQIEDLKRKAEQGRSKRKGKCLKSNWKIFFARISAMTTSNRFPKASRAPMLFSM